MVRFFFYGTLIAGSGNVAAAAVEGVLRDLGPAKARGRLYAVPDPEGWYPAFLPGEGVVRGRLYEALPSFTAAHLARLDAWEDSDPADPETSLYLREVLIVTGAAGACEAQAYRYNRPLPNGARIIGNGDFHVWLAQEGLRAFGA